MELPASKTSKPEVVKALVNEIGDRLNPVQLTLNKLQGDLTASRTTFQLAGDGGTRQAPLMLAGSK